MTGSQDPLPPAIDAHMACYLGDRPPATATADYCNWLARFASILFCFLPHYYETGTFTKIVLFPRFQGALVTGHG